MFMRVLIVMTLLSLPTQAFGQFNFITGFNVWGGAGGPNQPFFDKLEVEAFHDVLGGYTGNRHTGAHVLRDVEPKPFPGLVNVSKCKVEAYAGYQASQTGMGGGAESDGSIALTKNVPSCGVMVHELVVFAALGTGSGSNTYSFEATAGPATLKIHNGVPSGAMTIYYAVGGKVIMNVPATQKYYKITQVWELADHSLRAHANIGSNAQITEVVGGHARLVKSYGCLCSDMYDFIEEEQDALNEEPGDWVDEPPDGVAIKIASGNNLADISAPTTVAEVASENKGTPGQ